MDKLNFYLVFTILIYTVSVYGDLKITNLNVPMSLESDSSSEVILDCEYEVKDETGLEVKWFYNGNRQIYQWIPNRNSTPQALEFLKDRIDLKYKVSNNPNTMYRALKIKDVNTDLTGSYTCKITSFFNEETKTKTMIIYDPADEIELVHLEDTDTVVCTASGIHPKPMMNLHILGNKNGTETNEGDEDEEEDDNEKDIDVNENLFNVTTSLTYNEEDLSEVTVFVCDLWIPGTDYKEVRTLKYYPGDIPSTVETQIESDFSSAEFMIQTNSTDEDNSGFMMSGSCLLISIAGFLLNYMF